MKFGQQVKWLDGQHWHVGTVVANFGNGVWGVTHVMNPNQYTQFEFKVRQAGANFVTFHENMTWAEQHYKNDSLRNGGRFVPQAVPSTASVGAGRVLYKEQWKKQAGR
jgi:hypothetical protein